MELFSPQPWLRKQRTGDIKYIIIHSTRGPTTNELQYRATINWFSNPTNKSGRAPFYWGSSADYVVGHTGLVAKANVNLRTSRANWSAGWGGEISAYPADRYGISIELAQATVNTPFTARQMAALIDLCRKLGVQFTIPPRRIRTLTQNEPTIPRGYVGHEDTANGKKTGKTDPGPRFPWDWFIEEVASTGTTPPDSSHLESHLTLESRLATLEQQMAEIHAVLHGYVVDLL